jgi:cytochrome P450
MIEDLPGALDNPRPPRPATTPTTTGGPAPGPRGLALARKMWDLHLNAMTATVDSVREYGDVIETRMPGARMFTIHRAEHAEHVFVTNQDNYEKGAHHEIYAMALGQGLITANGELWRRQRRLLQPMFAKRHLDVFTEHMTTACAAMLDGWERRYRDGDVIDVAEAMMDLTLDVVGRALFGADLTGEVSRTIGRAMHEFVTEAHGVIYSPVTWAAYAVPGVSMDGAMKLRPRSRRRFLDSLNGLDAIVARMIESHRHGESRGSNDLLTLLLEARDEETGEPMSDRQIRDEIVNFIVAGHETTANTLAWTWQLLSQYPEARSRLLAEVDELLDRRVPTFLDAERLGWTRAVIHETLRLYPVVWMTARRAINDDVIGGVHIPAGSSVGILMYMTHRDPEIWPNPEGFDPTRFLGAHGGGPQRCHFIPFTAGRRICLGNTFAIIEDRPALYARSRRGAEGG